MYLGRSLLTDSYDGTNKTKPAKNVPFLEEQAANTGLAVTPQYEFLMPQLIQVREKAEKENIHLTAVLVPKEPDPLSQLHSMVAEIQKKLIDRNPGQKYTIVVVSPLHNAAVSNEFSQFHIEDSLDNLNFTTPVTRVESFVDNLNRKPTDWNMIINIIIAVILVATVLNLYIVKRRNKA